MLVAVGWGYVKWCLSIVWGLVPLIDHIEIKIWILTYRVNQTLNFR